MREIQVIESAMNDRLGVAPIRVYKWLQRQQQLDYVSGVDGIDGQDYFVTSVYGEQEDLEKFKRYVQTYPFDPKGRFAFAFVV